MPGLPVATDERTEIRQLYATGQHSKRRLAELYGRGRWTVSKIVADLTDVTVKMPPRKPLRAVPPPPGHQPLPVLSLRDLVQMRSRRWWHGVPERCRHCGGNLILGYGVVTCLACSREQYEVRP